MPTLSSTHSSRQEMVRARIGVPQKRPGGTVLMRDVMDFVGDSGGLDEEIVGCILETLLRPWHVDDRIAVNNVINGGKNDLRRNAWPANLRGEAALLVSLRSKQKSATVACPFLTE
jgi:hypothetical protein